MGFEIHTYALIVNGLTGLTEVVLQEVNFFVCKLISRKVEKCYF